MSLEDKIEKEDRVHPKLRGTPIAPVLRTYYKIEDHRRAHPPWYTQYVERCLFNMGTKANIPLAVYLGGGLPPSESERYSETIGKDKQFLSRWHARIVNGAIHVPLYLGLTAATQIPAINEHMPSWLEISSVGLGLFQATQHAAHAYFREAYHRRNPTKASVCIPFSPNALAVYFGLQIPHIAKYGARKINGAMNGAREPSLAAPLEEHVQTRPESQLETAIIPD